MKDSFKQLLLKLQSILRRLPCALRSIILLILLVASATLWRNESQEPMIAGIIIPGERYADGWYGANFDAASRACVSMGFELRTADGVGEREEDLFAACDNLLRMGAQLIVLTGPDDPKKFSSYMKSHPYVQFSGFDLSVEAPNYHPVFFRIYQARYLSGVLAAMVSHSHVLGYVAARPEPEVVRGINAFALGARSVRKDIKVLLRWTGDWSSEKEEDDAVLELKKAGADVLTYHQHEEYVPRACERYKINFIGMSMPLAGYSSRALTSVLCDWETYYRLLLRSQRDQNYVPPLWAGIDSGAVGLASYSARVPKSVRKIVDENKIALEKGQKAVFSGVIVDNQGIMHGHEGSNEDSHELLNMNYLVAGVETIHVRK